MSQNSKIFKVSIDLGKCRSALIKSFAFIRLFCAVHHGCPQIGQLCARGPHCPKKSKSSKYCPKIDQNYFLGKSVFWASLVECLVFFSQFVRLSMHLWPTLSNKRKYQNEASCLCLWQYKIPVPLCSCLCVYGPHCPMRMEN